jgi:hypothetical protein
MNDDVVVRVEDKTAPPPEKETAAERRERSLVVLLEALEGRLATPEYQEVLRILAPETAESLARGTGKG